MMRRAGTAYRRFRKRAFDLAVAVPAVIVLSPAMLALSLLVRAVHGSPVLFRQVRPGLHGKTFVMYKFRTMTEVRDSQGNPLPDRDRLTRCGRFLRSASLDELPELLNVVKGDMSLVGPRPLLSRYLPYYTERERTRHNVKPGITGWAQIHGRNETSWDERLERDAWYVENMNFGLDLKILTRTVLAVLRGVGVVADPRSIMRNLDEERLALREEGEEARTRP